MIKELFKGCEKVEQQKKPPEREQDNKLFSLGELHAQ